MVVGAVARKVGISIAKSRIASKVGKAVAGTVAGKALIGGAKKIGSKLKGKAGLVAGAVGLGALAYGAKKLFDKNGKEIKRRKGLVPKTVKKYVSKMSRRRDQEEKTLKKLIKGAGLMPKPKQVSKGIITEQEALRALKR